MLTWDDYRPRPVGVTIGENFYPIESDFRVWIEFDAMIRDPGTDTKDLTRFLLDAYTDTLPPDIEQAVIGALSFYHGEEYEKTERQFKASQKAEQQPRKKQTPPVYDFVFDAEPIKAAFLQAYGIDLETAPLHWHRFLYLFSYLPAETEIKQRIRYRSMDLGKIKDNKERARIQKIQRSIRIPSRCKPTDAEIGAAFW